MKIGPFLILLWLASNNGIEVSTAIWVVTWILLVIEVIKITIEMGNK